MRVHIIPDNEGNGEYLIIPSVAERENATEHFFARHMAVEVLLKSRFLRVEGTVNDGNEQQVRVLLTKQALQSWPAALIEMKAEPVPQCLTALLNAEDKKTQIHLLRGATINPKQLTAFVLEAEQQGFTYSKYLEKHLPSGLDRSKMPRFIEQQLDGSIKTGGQTSMSDNQLKRVVEQQRAVVATILDRGDEWHCFFATYRGLAGKENYKEEQGGQPHFHYISSKWGSVTRQQVIDGVRSGKYVSTSVHIDLLDYGTTASENTEQNGAEDLPALPVTGTGLPNSEWLGTNGSLYTHYYPANTHLAVCGRFNTVAQVRAAWAGRAALSKERCPSCARRLGNV